MKAVNRARRTHSYARSFGDEAGAVRAQPCLVFGCPSPAEAAHVVARGMGGAAADAIKEVERERP